ncbi:replication factor C small subunit [Candidatus Woesearchaeota archaeon]|nr:replication factor C small subunit [Candidatus Woesearchaeota archaeon]
MAGSEIWTEKYRPKEFSDFIGQDHIIKRVAAFVEQKNMPHMLFAGPAGTGKTSLAMVVAMKLFGEGWHGNFLELNASDERGIDVIRNKVKDFARTRALGEVPFKIIYLDESDALTKEAQQALRRTMENYTRTCRFILSCNYSSKIIEPIQSRCAVFRFRLLKKEQIFKLIERIVKQEKLSITQDTKEALFRVSEGDCRKLENILQSCAALDSKINAETVYSMAAFAKPDDITKILKLALDNKFAKARDLLLEVMLSYGLSGIDVVKQVQKETLNLEIDDRKKMQLINKCGEAEFRIVEGSDEFIQFEALLAYYALIGQQK